MKPKISIVTACLNCEHTIRKTIESVLEQTYDNFEYIVKDGGSTDRTIEIVKEYETKFNGRLRIVQKKDTCMYEGMNQGILIASGEMIGILNSDDYYSPMTLEYVSQIYDSEETSFLVVFGDMERISSSGDTICRYHFTQKMIEKKEAFGHPSMFVSLETYKKIGLYNTTYRLAADGEWQYRMYQNPSIKIVLCSEVFNHMRAGGASDQRKYRWVWFKERSQMDIKYNKAPKVIVYFRELISVIAIDIKAILPQNVQKIIYNIIR